MRILILVVLVLSLQISDPIVFLKDKKSLLVGNVLKTILKLSTTGPQSVMMSCPSKPSKSLLKR